MLREIIEGKNERRKGTDVEISQSCHTYSRQFISVLCKLIVKRCEIAGTTAARQMRNRYPKPPTQTLLRRSEVHPREHSEAPPWPLVLPWCPAGSTHTRSARPMKSPTRWSWKSKSTCLKKREVARFVWAASSCIKKRTATLVSTASLPSPGLKSNRPLPVSEALPFAFELRQSLDFFDGSRREWLYGSK